MRTTCIKGKDLIAVQISNQATYLEEIIVVASFRHLSRYKDVIKVNAIESRCRWWWLRQLERIAGGTCGV